MIDRDRLTVLLQRERATFTERHPRSAAAYADAGHLFGRVPMTWMNKTSAGFPIYLDQAQDATISDIDGNEYIDFSLGDTGAMAGHAPEAVTERVRDRLAGGVATMLPTTDAAWVGAELARRFGLPF